MWRDHLGITMQDAGCKGYIDGLGWYIIGVYLNLVVFTNWTNQLGQKKPCTIPKYHVQFGDEKNPRQKSPFRGSKSSSSLIVLLVYPWLSPKSSRFSSFSPWKIAGVCLHPNRSQLKRHLLNLRLITRSSAANLRRKNSRGAFFYGE